MKKKIMSMILAVCMTAGMAGCGSTPEKTGNDAGK